MRFYKQVLRAWYPQKTVVDYKELRGRMARTFNWDKRECNHALREGINEGLIQRYNRNYLVVSDNGVNTPEWLKRRKERRSNLS